MSRWVSINSFDTLLTPSILLFFVTHDDWEASVYEPPTGKALLTVKPRVRGEGEGGGGRGTPI